jgi:hypothetical protein
MADRSIGMLLAALVVGGCSMVPNMDQGTSGCANAVGIGPHAEAGAVDVNVMPDLLGLSPTEAAGIARSRGHTVVFNVQITGFGECWCVPPPEGTVSESFFTERGALMLLMYDVDVGHTADHQPATGWGCA